MTKLELLEAARTLLSDPANWCRRDYAQDAEGNGAYPESPAACRWCAVGAVEKFNPNLSLRNEAVHDLSWSAKDVFLLPHVITVNDNLGYEATLKTYDHAIAKLKGNQ